MSTYLLYALAAIVAAITMVLSGLLRWGKRSGGQKAQSSTETPRERASTSSVSQEQSPPAGNQEPITEPIITPGALYRGDLALILANGSHVVVQCATAEVAWVYPLTTPSAKSQAYLRAELLLVARQYVDPDIDTISIN